MDLEDELPRIHRNGATGMNQEPCGSENAMASCASDGTTGFGPGNRQNKQSNHQTMMKKGWNRWSTQKTKVMWTPLERWNGLAWVCMEWLWKGLARCGGEGSSGTTVFPQTQRVRLVSLCVGVTEPLPFLPSGQAMET